MYKFSSWLQTGGRAWKKTEHVADIPVTVEWVKHHFPAADGWPWDGTDLTDPEEDSTV